MSNLQLSAREVSVDHSPDFQRVGIFQLGRKRRIRKILIADGTGEAKYRQRAHGGGTAVGARGIGSAMNHGVTDFNAGRIAVENDAADLVSKDLEQLREFPEVALGAVNRGGEVAAETSSSTQKFRLVAETNQQRRGTKYFGT